MKSSELTRRRGLRAVALTGAVLGLAGCATMPGNGPVALGPTDAGSTQNTRVELIPVPPAEGESPDQLLHGYLDALGSDQADYRTARQYLSDPSWKPSGAVTVLQNTPNVPPVPASCAQQKTCSITVTGNQVAALDPHGSYTATPLTPFFSVDFHFRKNDKGQWRIVDPPSTVLTSVRDFQRIYASVNLYYPAVAGQTGGGVSPLVADPVFIRARVDNPLQTAAQQLLNGPSTWLQPAVNPGFTPGAKVVVDSTNAQAKVYLSLGSGGDWSHKACLTMAAQLYTTLSQVQGGGVQVQGQSPTSVALYQDKGGSAVCTAESEGQYNPVRVPATAYFLSPDHQLKSVTPTASGATPGGSTVDGVPGRLVPAGVAIGEFAVSPRGDGAVASVSQDGRSLYLSGLRQTSEPTAAVLRSSVARALSSPSFDGTGTLWFVDSEPGGKPLRAVTDGQVVSVDIPDLPGGATIEQVRVAPDGARIALLERTADGQTAVQIGRVARIGGGDDLNHPAVAFSVQDLRTTAVGISSISSLSWQDGDALVVVGQQSGTTSVIPVEIDDSPSSLGAIQALNGVIDVTALPGDPGDWLFATANSPDQEIFASQLQFFRWDAITRDASSKGSGVRFPG
ncbi:LpqB family beta-propeller domain-containing protein [Streptacidiphilus jiangxiensis]|uniref:Lipoprotein LpqB beta-propeller domain-containing protein n=1 Tax=Streptacidiphilus jiangxiensis TaxID=235985 RepID=A0A1H7RRX8_STRJI|nr:LpqB family beta-propeller domain-containing protein [Streptacidiphilus jiangxiensis]SEL62554.1 Lipoprotein LpqB beta-propeller domain-containing protein [Streptacidiphilus jiangxiensis]